MERGGGGLLGGGALGAVQEAHLSKGGDSVSNLIGGITILGVICPEVKAPKRTVAAEASLAAALWGLCRRRTCKGA